MPQMAPLMWLNLMLMFLLSFLVFFSLIYFTKLYVSPKEELVDKKIMQKTWKW